MKSTVKKRFFLFGGNHMLRLSRVLSLTHEIAGQMLGISPLSAVEKLRFWQEDLDAALEKANADYIVLDLHTAAAQLFSAGGKRLTATDENAALLHSDPIALVNPTQLPQREIHAALDGLADVLRTHFDHRHIILVHTHIPEFYWIGKAPRMKDNFASCAPRQKWLDSLEGYFTEKTRCHVVDIEKFYFHKKEEGRPLTDLIFEDLCYEDMASCVERVVCGGSGRSYRPDFRYSLRRYADGKFTLYQRGFTHFLRKDYLLDALILSAPKVFVEKHLEDLAALDTLDWTDEAGALKALDTCDASHEVRGIMYAFAKASAGEYEDPNADYACMLRNEIAPAGLLADLREKLCEKEKLLSGQINPGNAGYWFARMRGIPTAPFVTERTVERPTLVDVYGSCISRTAFNVYENDCAVNRYWFQVPPFESLNERVSYPASMFPERPHWADRLLKDQFDGVIYDQIAKSQASWLVIDLFSFITVVQYQYRGCYYTDFNGRVSKLLGAKSVMACSDPTVMGTWDEMLAKMEDWFSLLRKKYGGNIILINGQRNDCWIGDDGVIYRVKNRDKTTPFMDRAFRDVGEKLDCYCIDTYKPFLPDDRGFISNTPAHKEDECYLYAHELIRRIMTEKPLQKHYASYPGSIRIKRLLRLAEKNSPAKLEKALELSELDRCVIRMERQKIEEYSAELEALYDSGETSLKNLGLKSLFGKNKELFALLKDARAKGTGEAVFADGYTPYGKDCGIIGLNSFAAPTLRRVEIREISNDQSRVKLLCASAPGTTVLLFRKTELTDWQLVKRAPAGWIFDTEAQPLTDYQYMACTEAERDGKRYAGNFTPARCFRTGVATPKITNAVTVGGRNCITWQKVAGADGYYVYHKQEETDGWIRCDSVSGEWGYWSEPAENGKLYTLRAFCGTGAAQIISGHDPAVKVQPI